MSNCSETNRTGPRLSRLAAAAGFFFLLALPRPVHGGKFVELCRRGMRGIAGLFSFGSAPTVNETALFRSGELKVLDFILARKKLEALKERGVKVTVFTKDRGEYERMLVHIEAPNETLYLEAQKLVREMGYFQPDAVNQSGFGGNVREAMKGFDARGTGRRQISVLVTKGPVAGLREAARAEGYLDPRAQTELLASIPQATKPAANDATKRADKIRDEMKASLGKLTDVQYAGEAFFDRGETPYLDAAASANRHVMYFGSDTALSDVLGNYPLASTYHLVDNWGPGGSPRNTPGMKFAELGKKLANIGPNAKVETVSRGFLSSLGDADLATHPAFKTKMESLGTKPPVVMRVTWDSPSQGKQTRTFYFHHADFHDTAQLKTVLGTVPNGELGGALFQGGPFATREGVPLIMDKLAPDAAIAASASYYLDAVGDAAAATNGALTKHGADKETGFLLRKRK